MNKMSKYDGIHVPPEAHQDLVAHMMAAMDISQRTAVPSSRRRIRTLSWWAASVAALWAVGIFLFTDRPGTESDVWVTDDLAWEVFQAGELELSVDEAAALLEESELTQILADLTY